MLDRSMSMLMASSRVAARTTLTSQVLRLCPPAAASSSALALTDSGIRSVIRAVALLRLLGAGRAAARGSRAATGGGA